jgi:hypothetical protein
MKEFNGVFPIGVTLGRATYFGFFSIISQTVLGADKSPNQSKENRI